MQTHFNEAVLFVLLVTEVICVNQITPLSVLSYVAFDFHKECSHMRWERLQILVDAVTETQDEYG